LACHQHPEWLLTGAGGQFGQALLTSKSVGIELIATSRSGGGEDGASLDAAAGSQPVDAVIFCHRWHRDLGQSSAGAGRDHRDGP